MTNPSAPNVRRFPDAEEVSRAAAAELVRLARERVRARGRFAFALSGGSTPRRLCELLASPPFRDQVEWSKVEVFWGDERAVPPEHKDSNYGMAKAALLDRVPLPTARVHRIRGEEPDHERAARDYQEEIAAVLGADPAGPPPALDLVFLGMGADGHTASLFPHTRALRERTRWVVANEVPKLSAWRVTMTYPLLARADQVIFLVAGADKAGPLADVLEGPPDPERLPSQAVRPGPGALHWFVDEAAAAKLGR